MMQKYMMDGKQLKIENFKQVYEIENILLNNEIENEDDFLDVLIKCTSIAMAYLSPGKEVSVEEDLDLQTMYKILEVSADIKLNDPNLVATARAQAGMN
jgi:hypothetical protein